MTRGRKFLVVYIFVCVIGMTAYNWVSNWGWSLYRSELPVSDISYGSGCVYFRVIDGHRNHWVRVPFGGVGFMLSQSRVYTSVEFKGLSWFGCDADHAIIITNTQEDDVAWQKKVWEWRKKSVEEERMLITPRRVLPYGK